MKQPTNTSAAPESISVPRPKGRWYDRILHFFRKPTWTTKDETVLYKAFTIGGRTYYQFKDLHKQPFERGLTAIDYYEEVRMCTSRDFHAATYQAIINNCNGQGKSGKADLVAVGQLATQALQRTKWIYTPDLLYKLASVVFIDMDRESPFTYDFQIGTEKIEHWKKHKEAAAFFLQTPMIELVPFLKDTEIDFPTYSKVVQTFQRAHLELVSSLTSENSSSSAFEEGLISRINKQIELGD